MKLLVTGGAGFIGSHFVLYWMKNHPEDKIVNIDKLTYAANIVNLEGVQENCPKCGKATEIYDRIVGYIRPINAYNPGKREEFLVRKRFTNDAAA